MTIAAPIRLAMDVSDLDASTAFYRDLFGFEVQSTDRAGMIYESRVLHSPRFPALDLQLRAGFGRRVTGTGPGGVLRISLQVPDLNQEIARLQGRARWIGEPPKPGDSLVRFADPDAYIIELRGPGAA